MIVRVNNLINWMVHIVLELHFLHAYAVVLMCKQLFKTINL